MSSALLRAGAIAVAVAAGVASSPWDDPGTVAGRIFDAVLLLTPASATRDGIDEARRLAPETTVAVAAKQLGTGGMVSSQDTVPFTLWCVGQHINSFVDALWTTVGGFGDRDTTCAIVGGILGGSGALIPDSWLTAREPLQMGP